MSAPAKFLFDVDFAPSAERVPTITLGEHEMKLAEVETAAHRRGYAEAQNDASVAAGRRIAEALERVALSLGQATSALQTVEARLESEAVEVAVAVARKLAPALIGREPFAEIAALASSCFRELVASPHIVVRVNDALYAEAHQKLDDIARAHGLEGRLVVLGEPSVAMSDCRVEWADGGINRNQAATDTAIGEAVARYVSARRGLADGTRNTQEVRP